MTTRYTEAYLQPGCTVTLVAPYARDGGSGAKVGAFFGVAKGAVESGDEGEFELDGVFSLAKTSAQAWTQGDRIYWNDSTKACDTDSTAGMFIGIARDDAANPSSTGNVKLTPGAAMTEGAQAHIPDLTDSSGGATADGTIGVVTIPTALTGAGSGTANGALEAEGTVTTGGGNTYADSAVNAVFSKIENNIMELAACETANITAITALRDAVKELSTKQNALLAELRLAGVLKSS